MGPFELANLANRTELRLGNYPLNGPIPSELGNLSNLEKSILDNTQLFEPITLDLGNLFSLKVLGLAGNQFSGRVPTGLGDSMHHDLELVDLLFCAAEGLPVTVRQFPASEAL